MKIFNMKGYVPYPSELATHELGYNLADDTLSLKTDSTMVKRILAFQSTESEPSEPSEPCEPCDPDLTDYYTKVESDARFFPQYSNNSNYIFKEETNSDWRLGYYDTVWKKTLWARDDGNTIVYLNNVGNERKIVFADEGPPDVTIVSGSNANGEYLKLPSGTLICWGSDHLTFEKNQDNVFGTTAGAVMKGQALDLTFPIAFIAAPNVTVTGNQGKMSGLISAYITTSDFAAYGYYSISPPDFNWIAIGRWK